MLAIGGKYAAEGYWVGLGYNSANNPIVPSANGAGMAGIVNMFNNMFFPATIKNTITLGGGYNMSSNLDLEGSLAYSPKVTTRVDISGAGGAAVPAGTMFNTTTHSQTAVSVSLRYKF